MRCLIASWADTGHLRPLLPTAEALLATGHDVLIASDPRIGRERALGEVPVAVFPDPATLINVEDSGVRRAALAQMTPEGRKAASVEHFMRQAEAVTPALLDIIETYQPDVICREQSFFAGWLAAVVADLPVATFAFFPAPPASRSPIADRCMRALRNMGADADLDSLDEWLTIYPLPPSWLGDIAVTPTSHFVQPADPSHDVDDGTAAALLAGLPDRPTVYLTLGTVFADTPGLFQTVLDGVGSLDVNVIATTGTRFDAGTVRVPSNTRIASFVPQSLLLPHCDAVVAHGGYGSLMGALRAGLPVVSVPIAAADNVPNAVRLELLGAGRAVIDPERRAADVTAALAEILREPSYRTRAQDIADEIAALPPPTHAATLLDRLASTLAPVVDP